MKIIKLNKKNLSVALDEALSALRSGGLVVIPTDTVYGLAVMPDNKSAINKLFKAKQRDNGKPIAMLASDRQALSENGFSLTKTEKRLADKYWPGPLTLVLKAGRRKEGIRVPDNHMARELIRKAGGLLRVTSANISGNNPAITVAAALKELDDSVAVYLDAGRSAIGVASTVVEVKRGKPVILRQGAILELDIVRIAGTR